MKISEYPAQDTPELAGISPLPKFLIMYIHTPISVWQFLVNITLFCHENKIPKNPISWQPPISDSNIYQPAEPHNVSCKLHTLQICTCTPKSEGL